MESEAGRRRREGDHRGLRRPGDRRRTGLVMFEWHALGHVPLTRLLQPSRAAGPGLAVWDWFHINSIDLEPSQNLLISSRNTWAVYEIGHTYGEVLWTLGGRHSSFTLGPGVALRLAARRDASAPTARSRSSTTRTRRRSRTARARSTSRSTSHTHTATLLHEYVDPEQAVLSPSQGDVQQLDQHRPARRLGPDRPGLGVLDGECADLPAERCRRRSSPTAPTASRGSRQPAVPPALAASRARPARRRRRSPPAGTARPGVASWQVLAGASRDGAGAGRRAGAPSAGFETAITAATTRSVRGRAGARRRRCTCLRPRLRWP